MPFGHLERFAGFDACLCFEAGQLGPDGEEAVVVRRKAAGTLRVRAFGREAHSGSAPEKGANALLALTVAAQAVAATNDPAGDHALTSVPTILRSGDAFNVVPAAGELIGDLRARSADAFDAVVAGVPGEVDGVRLEAELLRSGRGWTPASRPRRCSRARPSSPACRSTAARAAERSDASHFADVDPGDDRRARPARRRSARAARVRLGAVAAAARGGGPRGGRRRAGRLARPRSADLEGEPLRGGAAERPLALVLDPHAPLALVLQLLLELEGLVGVPGRRRGSSSTCPCACSATRRAPCPAWRTRAWT